MVCEDERTSVAGSLRHLLLITTTDAISMFLADLFSRNPMRTICLIAVLFGVATPAIAQNMTEEKIGNSGWSLSTQRFSPTESSCLVTTEAQSSLFKFGIGSRGSLYLAVADVYLINQLSSVGLWKAGMEYRAQVFVGKDAPLQTEGQQYGDHTVMIRLPYNSVPRFSRASKVSINLNGLAMRGYDVPGMKQALSALIACAKKQSLIAP